MAGRLEAPTVGSCSSAPVSAVFVGLIGRGCLWVGREKRGRLVGGVVVVVAALRFGVVRAGRHDSGG